MRVIARMIETSASNRTDSSRTIRTKEYLPSSHCLNNIALLRVIYAMMQFLVRVIFIRIT